MARTDLRTTSFKLWEDTLIHDQTYTELYYSIDSSYQKWVGTGIFLRQEGARIYEYRSKNETEMLLYDFGMQPGDEIEYNACKLQVAAVDSIQLLDGSIRKRWRLKGNIGEYEWIEGVGALSSLTNHWNTVCRTDFTTRLGCYSENGEVLLKRNAACFVVKTKDLRELNNQVAVYPNPTNGFLNIKPTFQTTDKLRYKIYNTLGQQVTESFERDASPFTINIGGLKKGIYYLEILKKDGIKIIKKIEKL